MQLTDVSYESNSEDVRPDVVCIGARFAIPEDFEAAHPHAGRHEAQV